jgi:hypothetical protein
MFRKNELVRINQTNNVVKLVREDSNGWWYVDYLGEWGFEKTEWLRKVEDDKYCVIVGVHIDGQMIGFIPKKIYSSKQNLLEEIDKYSDDYIKILDKDFRDVTAEFRY